MGFLLESGMDILEAEGEGEEAEGGEGSAQSKEEKQLAGLMPKAMDATLDAFNGFKSVASMPPEMKAMFDEVTKKVSDHVQNPDSPEAISDFKTAEELHALIVMMIDRYAVAIQAKIKAGQNPSDVNFGDIRQKALKDSQAAISNKISKLPFLQRAVEGFKEARKNLQDRLKGLYSNWVDATGAIGRIDPGQVIKIATDKNFAGQRDIQGTVVSNPKIDPALAKNAQEQAPKSQFDDNQKKLIDQIGERKKDFEKVFNSFLSQGKLNDDAYDLVKSVLEKFDDDPEKTYANLEKLGPKGKNVLSTLVKQAEDNFEELDLNLKSVNRKSDVESIESEMALASGGKIIDGMKKRVKDLRAANDYKLKKGDVSEIDGNLIDTYLEKLEKADDPRKVQMGPKTSKALGEILVDAKNDFEDLDSTLKAMKKAAPKFEVDFGIPVEKLEELVRNFIDAPADKSQSAIQNEFISGLEEAGSDEKTYSAAFAKADKYGGIDNPKALKAMGLEKLANEKEGAGGEGEAPELAGKTLSSVLFNTDASVKKKLDPVGEKVKSSLVSLKAALDSYTANKGGKKNRAALLSAIKDSQDSLKGVKLESTQSKDNVLIERWQKLAGII